MYALWTDSYPHSHSIYILRLHKNQNDQSSIIDTSLRCWDISSTVPVSGIKVKTISSYLEILVGRGQRCIRMCKGLLNLTLSHTIIHFNIYLFIYRPTHWMTMYNFFDIFCIIEIMLFNGLNMSQSLSSLQILKKFMQIYSG